MHENLLSRIARHLVKRAGSDVRIEELSSHLDEREAHGQPLSLLDVGSIAILALRAPLQSAARFAQTYASVLLAALALWTVAIWVGAVGALEASIADTFALEEFQFIERQIFLVFAFVALAALALVNLVRFVVRKRRLSS